MGPSEEVQTFDSMTLRGRRWFFRVVETGNNEVLAQSQPYKSHWARNKTAKRFADAFGCRVVAGKSR